MANVDFRLRHNGLDKNKQLKTEKVSIQVYYYHQGVEVELATGLQVKPEHWDGSRATGTPEAKRINKELAKLETELYNVHIDHRGKAKAEHEAIVRQIIKGEVVQKKTVEQWIADYIESCNKKESSKQVDRSTLTHLNNYVAKEGITLSWESFTMAFYDGFTAYLYTIPRYIKKYDRKITGLEDNTVGKIIKTIKNWISQAFERDLHQNLNFKKKGFRVITAEVDEIYLDESEVIKINNVSGLSAELEESKKRFVFNCWVGLRFGDMNRINPNQITKGITGGSMLKVTTAKTGEDVMIPLHPVAEEIWNSWGCRPPEEIANPTFNEHIKIIAEKAGLTTPTQKRTTIKGAVTIEWVPKFTMVKAHTCRRSFATNCFLLGVPTRTIMAVTGHRTEKAFLKYIRVTKEQHANIMAGYFHKSTDQPLMKAQ